MSSPIPLQALPTDNYTSLLTNSNEVIFSLPVPNSDGTEGALTGTYSHFLGSEYDQVLGLGAPCSLLETVDFALLAYGVQIWQALNTPFIGTTGTDAFDVLGTGILLDGTPV